jgi:hypothetical protein
LEASSRSSIVFSVLAIEIAIKEVIARLSPQSTWLIDNLNSPPIEKILKEFIPILLKVDTQFDPELLLILRKVIFNRNQVIHKRDFIVKESMSSDAFNTASEIIAWAEVTLHKKSSLNRP